VAFEEGVPFVCTRLCAYATYAINLFSIMCVMLCALGGTRLVPRRSALMLHWSCKVDHGSGKNMHIHRYKYIVNILVVMALLLLGCMSSECIDVSWAQWVDCAHYYKGCSAAHMMHPL